MIKKALLTGSGSEINSWLPIERALNKNYRNIPSKDSNLLFANLTYQLRWLKKYSSYLRNFNKLKQTYKLKKIFKQRLSLYNNLKKDICTEIQVSSSNHELKLNTYIDLIIQNFLGDKFMVLTTNWDKLLEEKLNVYVHHIHGSIDDFDSLYLPTEVIEENYRNPNSHIVKTGQAMDMLERINKLYIYGLSLSPLDIELSFILSDTYTENSHIDEITIFDKSESIDLVEQRLRFILNKKN